MIPLLAGALAAPQIPDPLRAPDAPLLSGPDLRRCRKKGVLPDSLVDGRITRTADRITLGGREVAGVDALRRVLDRTRQEIELLAENGCELPIHSDRTLTVEVDPTLPLEAVWEVMPAAFSIELPVAWVTEPPGERPDTIRLVHIDGAGLHLTAPTLDLPCAGVCSEDTLPWEALAAQRGPDTLYVVTGHPEVPWSTALRAFEVLSPSPVALAGSQGDRIAPTWTGSEHGLGEHTLRLLPAIAHDDPGVLLLGALPREAIDAVIRTGLEDVRACFLPHATEASGKVVVEFRIGPDGTVVSSRAKVDEVGHGVGECVSDAMARLVFPEPSPTGNVLVSYPFLFTPE